MPATTETGPGRLDVIRQLRAQVQTMQSVGAREELPIHPALAGMVTLHTGGSYAVDRIGLAMALMAEASAEGAWSAVVGCTDFGVEAAAALSIELNRTVLVPDPGERWVEVTAALIDMASVVVVQPPVQVDDRTANRLAARLRKRSAALIVVGEWPRCDARIGLSRSDWSGPDRGHGHLVTRQAVLTVRRGTAPPVEAPLWVPGDTAPLGRVDEESDERRTEPALRAVG